MKNDRHNGRRGSRPALAVVLGTNEIASAVAVYLHRNNYGVVMSHDPLPPVIRRKMAFHDALFNDPASVEGVTAERVDSGLDILSALSQRHDVIITQLGLLDIIVLRPIDILIDARLQKYEIVPDLRRLARLTLGLGPGFCAGANCDIAIETRPAATGAIIQQGATDLPDRVAARLGNAGNERFIYAPHAGRWHTAIDIGTLIFKGFHIGNLGGTSVRAPFDGVLRGVARDGTEVPASVKLLEVDPRGRRASWTGIDARGRKIAKAVLRAIAMRGADSPAARIHPLHVVE